MLRLGAVKVNNMQALKTDTFEFASHVQWLTVNGFLVVVALRQAYTLAVDDVDSRNQFYHNSRKFLMMRSPTAPLFSGWNWQV